MNEKKDIRSFAFYCLLFFVLAFLGWLWEVGLYFFTEHTFVNRGVYKGPYLPIYGAGGVLIYFMFHRMKKHPFWVFFGSILLCCTLEYATGWFLEEKWGIRWWDYSDHFLNLNGRICLLSTIAFGICGTGLVCLIFPFYEKMYAKIPYKLRNSLMILFLLIFLADAASAADFPNVGKGISY